MTSQNFASKSGSVESLKTRVRCGLISFSLQTRCTVALETPNSRAIARPVHRARPPGARPGAPAVRLRGHPQKELRANVAFAARAGLILQRPKPTSDIAPSPLRDLVIVQAAAPSDGPASHS